MAERSELLNSNPSPLTRKAFRQNVRLNNSRYLDAGQGGSTLVLKYASIAAIISCWVVNV